MNEVDSNRVIGERYISIMRGWNAHEQRKNNSINLEDLQEGIKPVDFDLVPDNCQNVAMPIIDRRDAENSLLTLFSYGIRAEGVIVLDRSREDGEFLSDRIRGNIAYIRKLRGEGYSNEDYIRLTMGELLTSIPDEAINNQSARVAHLLAAIDSEKRYEYNPRGFQSFMKDCGFNPSTLPRRFVGSKKRLIPAMEALMGPGFKVDYSIETTNVDRSWINWASATHERGKVLTINTNPQNANRMVKGVADMLTIHEICSHFVQAERIHQNVLSGTENSIYDMTTIPGVEQWGMEGMAMTLPRLIPVLESKLSRTGMFSVEYTILMEWVYHNAATYLLKGGKMDNSVRDFIVHHLPGESNERIDSIIANRTRDIADMSYKPAYAQGSYYFIRVADKLNRANRDGGIKLVQLLNQKLRTPVQIKRLVESEFGITEESLDVAPTIGIPDKDKKSFWNAIYEKFGGIFHSFKEPQQSQPYSLT